MECDGTKTRNNKSASACCYSNRHCLLMKRANSRFRFQLERRVASSNYFHGRHESESIWASVTAKKRPINKDVFYCHRYSPLGSDEKWDQSLCSHEKCHELQVHRFLRSLFEFLVASVAPSHMKTVNWFFIWASSMLFSLVARLFLELSIAIYASPLRSLILCNSNCGIKLRNLQQLITHSTRTLSLGKTFYASCDLGCWWNLTPKLEECRTNRQNHNSYCHLMRALTSESATEITKNWNYKRAGVTRKPITNSNRVIDEMSSRSSEASEA